jgi:hypothetical protein
VYRPGYEHAVDLKAKVIVVAARGMVLDDESQPVLGFPALSSPLSTWLGATAGPPFTPVFVQGHAKGIPVCGF